MLKSAGHYVGWGFQFQSPAFLVFMAVLFFWLGLNLFGVFEVGTALTRIENAAGKSFLLNNSFMNGVLATVVATPCTAPFMGTALGYALSQSSLVTFLVFSALALGLAFPYLLFSANPQFLRFIPKPGPWMIVLKKMFGVFFMATVAWLAWVLQAQRGSDAVLYLCVGLAIITVAGWVIGRFAVLSRSPTVRWRSRAVAVVLFLAGFSLAMSAALKASEPAVGPDAGGKMAWLNYSPESLADAISSGRPVFLDFTAKWCLSCQVNERVALYHPKVIAAFKGKNTVMIKADWTNYDDQVTKALNSYGKNSIPVYVLYPGSKSDQPVFLPELLTPGIVLNELEKL